MFAFSDYLNVMCWCLVLFCVVRCCYVVCGRSQCLLKELVYVLVT